MLRQVLFADARLAVEAMQRGFTGDADQVAVAFFILSQHQQVVVFVALRVGPVVFLLAYIQLAAQDRLDSLLFGRFEKVDRAVDVAVVGDGHRGLPDVLDALDKLVDIACAVKKREVGVEVQVCEFSHGDWSYFSLPGPLRTLPQDASRP